MEGGRHSFSGSDGSSSFDFCEAARGTSLGVPAADSCAWAACVAWALVSFAEPFSLDWEEEGMVS